MKRAAAMIVAATICALITSPGSAAVAVTRSRYDGPGHTTDQPRHLVLSPNGNRLYVAGFSWGVPLPGYGSGEDFVTIAYESLTGRELWVARHDGAGHGPDVIEDIAISHDGARIYVTGTETTGFTAGGYAKTDIVTIAYNAMKGTELWLKRYDAGETFDSAAAIAVTPDDRVFVTGTTTSDVVTAAYRGANGNALWTKTYDGPLHGGDNGRAIAVSPWSDRVYVSGITQGSTGYYEYLTLAYATSSGSLAWVAAHHAPGTFHNLLSAARVSPGGDAVFVTGMSGGTVAYEASTGSVRWVAGYAWDARDLAVAQDGTRVYVTGSSWGGDSTRRDATTVAHDARTGAQAWTARYDGGSPSGSDEEAWAIAVSRNGKHVFVTGNGDGGPTGLDFVTVGYNAATGKQAWMARETGPGIGYALDVATHPSLPEVFITGFSYMTNSGNDIITLGYLAQPGTP